MHEVRNKCGEPDSAGQRVEKRTRKEQGAPLGRRAWPRSSPRSVRSRSCSTSGSTTWARAASSRTVTFENGRVVHVESRANAASQPLLTRACILPGFVDLRSLTPAEIEARVRARGQPPYRAEQVFRWLHGPGWRWQAGGRGGRARCGARATCRPSCATRCWRRRRCGPLAAGRCTSRRADGTRKLRFRTHDGRAIESVLIPDDKPERGKLTLCISSQVGCALDCQFCATATLGFARHLSAGEIVEQVYHATALAGRRPTNIVFMGMGEPLHNLANVTPRLLAAAAPLGRGAFRRGGSRSRPWGWCSGIDELAQAPARPQPGHLAQRHHRRGARPDHAGQQALAHRRSCWPPPAASRWPTAGGSPSSTCCSPGSTTATRTPPACPGCCAGSPAR